MKSEAPQAITYEIAGSASLSDIAQSLISIERITREVGPFMEGTVAGLTIERIEITLREVTQRSPVKEVFWLAVFMSFQKDLEKQVPAAIEQMTGVEMPDGYESIITVIALLIIFYGVDYVYQRLSQAGPSRKIRRVYDGLVKETAERMGVSEEVVTANLEARYGGGKIRAILRAAVGFFSIAKREKNSSILVGSQRIGADVIAEIPSDVDLANAEPDETSEQLEDVEIELHAQDLDRTKQGWAGVIPSEGDERLRMTMYPPLKPEDIYRRDKIRGDVILLSKRQDSGGFKPYMFHLVRLRD